MSYNNNDWNQIYNPIERSYVTLNSDLGHSILRTTLIN